MIIQQQDQLQIEVIESYLRNQMTAAERKEFEKRLQADAAFAEQVQNVRLAARLLSYYGLKKHIYHIHQQAMSKRHHFFRGFPLGKSVALAIAVLLLIAGLQMIHISPANLYQTNYQPYQVRTVRGEINTQTLEKNIEEKYRNNQYQECLEVFESNRLVASLQSVFLAGNAYMALSKPVPAAACFEQIVNEATLSTESQLYRQAEWYLMLCLLRTNQVAEAESLYIHMHSQNNPQAQNPWFLWQLKVLKLKHYF